MAVTFGMRITGRDYAQSVTGLRRIRKSVNVKHEHMKKIISILLTIIIFMVSYFIGAYISNRLGYDYHWIINMIGGLAVLFLSSILALFVYVFVRLLME